MSKSSLIVLLLIMLPSCGTRHNGTYKLPVISAVDMHELNEAKWSDVPLPEGKTNYSSTQSADGLGCFFFFKLAMPFEHCVAFYSREMECEGWDCRTMLDFGSRIVALWYKPAKSASVELHRINQMSTEVKLILAKQRTGTE